MIYQRQEVIGLGDLDANGDTKLAAVLKYASEAALFNAEELGIGLEKTLSTGLVFLIQRFGMKINQLPGLGQTVTVRTWPGKITRSAFKRYGDIQDETGNRLIEWETLWVLVDINERKMKRPNAFPIEFPHYGEFDIAIESEKIIIPEEKTTVASYNHPVRFSELDINLHMNNAIYGDLIANVLAQGDSLNMKDWQEVQFNYIHEAKIGDEITVDAYQAENNLYVLGTCGDKSIFNTKVKYKERV